MIQRSDKADEVERLARALVQSVIECCGSDSVTYYLHSAAMHFPHFIRVLPCDIMDASGSGIEIVNQYSKKALL
jgi:hypothetical protein